MKSARADPLRAAIVTAALAASALVLSAGNVVDPDLWGHVRFGRDILASRAVAATCTYSYTASDQRWLNQEWLSEVILAGVDVLAGPVGWLVMKALLGVVVFAIVIGAALRRGVSPLVTAVVVVLTAYNVAPGWNIRPHVFTYMLFVAMIVLLDRGTDPETPGGADARRLWVVPVLFALWGNLHGAFSAGYALLGLYLLCRAAEACRRHGAAAARRIGLYVGVLVVAAALTAVNPYGPRLWSWALRVAFEPRAEISEWQPLRIDDPRFPPFVALAVTVAAAWLTTRRRRDATQTVLLVVAAWQSVAHVRHIPFFALLAALWVPPHLDDACRRFRDNRTLTPRATPARAAAVWLATAALTVAVALRSRALWVDSGLYPIAAFDFMATHALTGKLVVNADWAWYAIAAFAPETRVAFDYRVCYPLAVADMQWDFFLDEATDAERHRGRMPPGDATAILHFRDPELVLLTRRLPHATEVMDLEQARARFTHTPPAWVLLYQDAVAQLWGRRDIYDDAASPRYLPASERRIGDAPQPGLVRWPALPERRAASPPHPF